MAKITTKLKTAWRARNVALQLIRCKLLNKRIPIRASLQITKYCNLRCPYCYASNNNPETKERTTEEIFALLNELYSRGTRWINILGGEPLLRKDIGQIVDYAKRKGFFVEMATNGWFVGNHIETLRKVGHLFISIDGDKETCDITRGPGTYEKIMESIELLKKNGIKFRLHAVLTKFSKDSFQHMLDLSKKFDAPVNFSEPGVCDSKRHVLLPEEEVIEFYKRVQEYKKKGYRISSPWIALKYLNAWPLKGTDTMHEKDSSKIKKAAYPCYMKHRNCFIDVDGGFYSCGKRWGEGLNLYEDGFDKCWEHLKNLPCYSCKNMGAIEQSLVLSVNIKAMINVFFNYIL